MYTKEYQDRGLPLLDAFGTKYPAAFTHPLREYHALRSKVALIDLSHQGALRLTGGDAVSFLNTQITNNIASLTPGQACRAALATTKGKLVAELVVLCREGELFVLVAQGDTNEVMAALDKHIIADDVTLENVSDDIAVISAEGPKSREIAWHLFPEGPIPGEPMTFVDNDYQGMPVTVLRHSVTGPRGFQFVLSGEARRLVRNYILQTGLGMDAEECGLVAWNMRRVEYGLPWWGADINDNFPAECRLEDLVDYEKGCFLGQETIARMHYRGHPNWRLVGLVPAAGTPAALTPPDFIGVGEPDMKTQDSVFTGTSVYALPTLQSDAQAAAHGIDTFSLQRVMGTEMFEPGEDNNKAAGHLTSPVFSPALKTFLSLGYVRNNLSEPGTEFDMNVDGEAVRLAIAPLPVDRENK